MDSYSNVLHYVKVSDVQVPLAMLHYHGSTKREEKELRSSLTQIYPCRVKRRLLGRSVVPNTMYLVSLSLRVRVWVLFKFLGSNKS